MLFIFGVGGGTVAKLATKVVAEYSSAATIAEEVLSSVRTVQAFGTEERLARHYDESLARAQKIGFRQAAAVAIMFSLLFPLLYLANGLAFCNFLIANCSLQGKGRE
jgi:ATP-binding cassette subfamily B (MDR/TAP) protein 1